MIQVYLHLTSGEIRIECIGMLTPSPVDPFSQHKFDNTLFSRSRTHFYLLGVIVILCLNMLEYNSFACIGILQYELNFSNIVVVCIVSCIFAFKRLTSMTSKYQYQQANMSYGTRIQILTCTCNNRNMPKRHKSKYLPIFLSVIFDEASNMSK